MTSFITCVVYFDGSNNAVIPTQTTADGTSGTITFDAQDRFGISKVSNFSAVGTNYITRSLPATVSCKTAVMWINPKTISSSRSLLYLSADLFNTDSTTTFSSSMSSPTKYYNGSAGNTLSADTWQMIAVTSSTAKTDSTVVINNGTNYGLNGYVGEIFLFSDVKTEEFINRLYLLTSKKYIYPNRAGERNCNDT